MKNTTLENYARTEDIDKVVVSTNEAARTSCIGPSRTSGERTILCSAFCPSHTRTPPPALGERLCLAAASRISSESCERAGGDTPDLGGCVPASPCALAPAAASAASPPEPPDAEDVVAVAAGPTADDGQQQAAPPPHATEEEAPADALAEPVPTKFVTFAVPPFQFVSSVAVCC